MATLRYQVVPALVGHLAPGPNFTFRVGYSKPEGSGVRKVHYSNAPILAVPKGNGIVQTSDEIAQKNIAAMIMPQNTQRGQGANPPTKRPSGSLFVDVTDTTTAADLDLDLDQILV